jgi:hypothetical protein
MALFSAAALALTHYQYVASRFLENLGNSPPDDDDY